MINSSSTEVQSQNIVCLIKITSCLCYLARQGLSLNGHGNDQDSNFKQLVKCCAEDDPFFRNGQTERAKLHLIRDPK